MAVISVLTHGKKFENHYQYGADRENAGKHFIKFTPFIHVPGKAVLYNKDYTGLSEETIQKYTNFNRENNNDAVTPLGRDLGAANKSYNSARNFFSEGFDNFANASTAFDENNPEQGNRVVTRSPMMTSQGSVKLFLPAQISVSQKVNYAEAEMGGMLAAAMGAVSSYSGNETGEMLAGIGDSIAGATQTAGLNASDAGMRLGAKLLEGVGVTGAKAYHNIKSGVNFNNRSEMMFEGIDRRSFAFTFRLIPHSAKEAAEIQNIVTSFRYYMLPEIPEGMSFGRALKPPSTYMISYSHQDTLHKIGECFLESVDVKYGGERPQFYNDNRPTETELTLQFKEMDIMTKRKVLEGF